MIGGWGLLERLRAVEEARGVDVVAVEGGLRAALPGPHAMGHPERVLEELEALARAAGRRTRGLRDSSSFQAAPMPSQARPPDSTSSVVAALTHRPGWR